MGLHVVVQGRVQGVGFRWYVREQARLLGVRGWVRNRPDGSVEVAADGKPEALQSLRAWLNTGPPGANVTGVHDTGGEIDELPHPFAIVR
jgi:acylphosphatase